jgi:hypothetical protein
MNTPLGIERAVGVLIFTIGISLVALHTLLLALSAARSPLQRRTQIAAPLLAGVYLSAWLGLSLVAGDVSNFHFASLDRRLVVLVVGMGPMIAAVALLYRSRTMHAIHAAMPPEWLIWAQTYRVAGVMFLFPFLYYRVIPAGFAIPAAVGDFLTGLAAPWVASRVAQRRPGALTLAIAWNLFGIADLIVAPLSAVLSQAPVLTLYPLVLVPLFAGPPMGILTHVRSLRALAVASNAAPAGPGRTLDDAVGAA